MDSRFKLLFFSVGLISFGIITHFIYTFSELYAYILLVVAWILYVFNVDKILEVLK